MKFPNRIKEWRVRTGLTLEKVAEVAKTTNQTISRLEKGQRRLTLDWMVRIAPAFEVEPKDLIQESVKAGGKERPETPEEAPPRELVRLPMAQHNENPKDLIPVRSAGRGGNGQEMFLADGPIEYTRRPTVLETVTDAYAIYMVGDSMEPRYYGAFLLYVHPHKPPRPGRAVVVTKKNNEVMVKLFARRDNSTLYLKQLNPPDDIEVPLSEIADIHLVVGSSED